MNMNTLTVGHCSNPSIDVAVIDMSINEIFLTSDVSAHLVVLDNINITSSIFHALFYDTSGNFALNPLYKYTNSIRPYVGINKPYRTYENGRDFCLLDEIFENIEDDLNVCRTAFTPCTNIALNRQLMGLKTFYDLGLIKLACWIDWNTILEMVACLFDDYNVGSMPSSVKIDLIISIVFKTPTVGVLPTIVKLVYTTEFGLASVRPHTTDYADTITFI